MESNLNIPAKPAKKKKAAAGSGPRLTDLLADAEEIMARLTTLHAALRELSSHDDGGGHGGDPPTPRNPRFPGPGKIRKGFP